ncbi:hypothetical protein [Sphingomonas sp. AX6]|uniref:hypothetical protein n=1 Tax=Sphingomonas sp. AX6 TaxID=2653171 RepID=UPI0012F12A1D|nr:hypothetical protein [Sphingomonas sp. AX6]VXC63608.1 conserved hypothetical protein [Sphingomonas sp. AX6]
MAIDIPWVRINRFALRPRLFSSEQEGALGGPDLPNPRVGDRWIADVSTAILIRNEACTGLLTSLMRASTDSARMEVRAYDMPAPGVGGGAVVNGAGQTGSTLAVRGLTVGAVVRYGQPFSINHLGVHYLYMAVPVAPLPVPAGGQLSIPIWPMLRFITVDAEKCHFDDPMIEGALVGFDKGRSFVRDKLEPVTFSIRERR